MKLRQRVMSMLLTVAMIIGLAPVLTGQAKAATSGTCGKNLTWELDEEGTLAISGTGKMDDYEYNKHPWDTREVKSVFIETGITDIGKYAFSSCGNMKNVILPDGLKSIGYGAFESSGIEKVVIPKSVENISDDAFRNSALKEITIPGGVKNISSSMFAQCKQLESVRLEEGVECIGWGTFYECGWIKNLYIPSSLKKIEECVFHNSGVQNLYITSLESWCQVNKVGESCSYPFQYGGNLYLNNKIVTEIKIPSTIEEIPQNTFRGCLSISSVNIGSNVKIIGGMAFQGCTNLKNVTIENGVTEIGAKAFSSCSIEQIDLPSSTVKIGTYAFSSTPLKEIEIPENVQTIGAESFYYCKNLKTVKIPESVSEIGGRAFEATESLLEFIVDDKNKNFSNDEFGSLLNKDKTELIMCPAGNLNPIIPSSVKSIADSAFCDHFNLKSIYIPEGVENIGFRAFSCCTNLETIYLPATLKQVGDIAFYQCNKLKKVNISDIGAWSQVNFKAASSNPLFNDWGLSGAGLYENSVLVTDPVIPLSVKSIGNYSFYGYKYLKTIHFSENLETIGIASFQGCNNLRAYFWGDAPRTGTYWNGDSFGAYNSTTVYYLSGKKGWTSPTWNGCKSEVWVPNDSSPNDSKVYVTDFWPNQQSVNEKDTLCMIFNTNVRKGNGTIHFTGCKSGTEPIDVSVNDENVEASNKQVKISLSGLKLVDGSSYYVTVDSGAFVSEDGTPFYGMLNRDAWKIFMSSSSVPTAEIDLKWAKKGPIWNRIDDISKPPVPNGTTDQYANALQTWAKRAEVRSITKDNARELLEKPVYLPLTDVNGSTVQMFDKGTTVQQVMEDIIFIEQLQPYIDKIDAKLDGISEKDKAFSFGLETEIYNSVASWYGQIGKYMKERDENSNFFLSVGAPLAYDELIELIGDSTGPYSKYINPMLKATLSSNELDGLKSLKEKEEYSEVKDTIETAIKGGKKLYKALDDNKYGGLIEFGVDTLAKTFEKTDNDVLKEIGKSWKDFSDVKTAVQLCMLSGSTVGMFPMVVDLYTTLSKKVDDQVQAFYFLGDYYISEKRPDIYETVFDEETCLAKQWTPEFDTTDIAFIKDSSDINVLRNWCNYFYYQAPYKKASKCREMRYDLTNYALLSQFAKSIDTNQVKEMLVRYLDAELHEGATTGIYAKCPVTVEIYDKNGNKVASLSSKDDEIASCEYGTLYLLGENNETKYFLLNDNTYTAKIIPYDTGKMDVMIVETAEDGTQDSRLYENVSVQEGLTFQTATGTEDKTLYVTGTEESKIEPEETIPVTGVSLSGPKELALGETEQMTGTVCPSMATDKALTWGSSDTRVITVDPSGEITAQGVGSAEITATATNGMKESVTVQVYQPAESISADVEELTMVAGESNTLEVTVSPENTTHSISWSSSDPSVAVVDEAGVIQALSEGETMLTATCDGVSRGIALTVYDDLLHLELYQSDTEGDRVRVDMKNCSLSQTMDGTLYLAFYDGEKMLTTRSCQVSLKSGDTETIYLPMSRVPDNARYTVKAFLLGTDNVPIQVCKESVVIGKMTR